MTNSLLTKQTENLLLHTLDDTLKPQIEEILALGSSAGADLVEVFLEKSDNISLLAEQEDISNVSPSFGVGAGIRVFLGKKDGFVSTNDISKPGLLYALNQALGMLGLVIGSKNKVEFEGSEHSLSSAGLIATNRFGFNWKSVAGPLNWKFEGEILDERRKRYESGDE